MQLLVRKKLPPKVNGNPFPPPQTRLITYVHPCKIAAFVPFPYEQYATGTAPVTHMVSSGQHRPILQFTG